MKLFSKIRRICFVTGALIALVTAIARGQWQPNGVPVVTVVDGASRLAIVSDGMGGAIIAWEETRNGEGDWNIYAQRLNAAGVRQWPASGVPICTATGRQGKCVITSDGAGGAVLAWEVWRAPRLSGGR